MWLGVCGGIPRPPKNPSKRKKGGGERGSNHGYQVN